MVPRHFRCVVLVIAHRDAAYTPFKDMWEVHWNVYTTTVLHSMARFYLYNDPDQREAVVPSPDGSSLTFPYEETYPAPGLLLKTMDAIQYLANQNITYDHLLRTNLSSLFHWPAFVARLSLYGPEWSVAGVEYKPKHVSGMCLLLSGEMVGDLTRNREKLDFATPDDHAIALYLLEHHPDLQYHQIPSITIQRPSDVLFHRAYGWLCGFRHLVHIRFHSGYGVSGNRHVDHDNMRVMQQILAEGDPQQHYVLYGVITLGIIVVTFMVYMCRLRKDVHPNPKK